MKRYIYIIVFVFATLFCQAFGAENEWPQLLDTTICAKPNEIIHMSDFAPRILELLQNREDSIWSECCDTVTVKLGDISGTVIENNIPHPFKGLPDEKINTEKTIQVDVKYTRELVCTKIPSEKKSNMPPASLAMWHLFGKLISETETGKVIKISDEATVTTLHQATFVFKFGLALPEDPLSRIIEKRGGCFEENDPMDLSVGGKYTSYRIRWTIPKGIKNYLADTVSPILIQDKANDYLYSIVCTAIACKGETRSDTIKIGNAVPVPEIDDLGCIAANDTLFEVNVSNPNSQLSYYWSVEDWGNGSIIDTQQGASVTMKIPQNESVKLKLVSTGGCRDAEMEPVILHRSLVSEAHHIEMEAESHCIFAGDTLRLSLSETPEDILVWQIAGNTTMLPPHDTYGYPTVQAKDNVVVSVYAKACPNDIITDTFNIREDFKVSLGTSPMCISANEYQVIKLTSNGINPEVHWYGNGVEIDSSTYKKEDSIRLKLTNPGDPNLYVKVIAAECGKFSKDSISLRPKPEKPSLDPLLGVLTPCIPLGMADTIELRVQPQESVKFNWNFSDNEKFQRIAKSDSHSIRVRVNYDLSDRNTSIPVNIYASTDDCPDSEPLQDTLYATGAGLGEEWFLFPNKQTRVFQVGFSQDGQSILKSSNAEFEDCTYQWFLNGVKENGKSIYYTVKSSVAYPFIIACKITNSRASCYSVYDTIVTEEIKQTKKNSEPEKSLDIADNKKGQESKKYHVFRPNENQTLDIVLHPNPVHSGTQVKVEGICETESFTVECYSPQGRRLFRTTAKGDTFTLPTDNYAGGVYIVKIQLDGAISPIVKKLIIL